MEPKKMKSPYSIVIQFMDHDDRISDKDMPEKATRKSDSELSHEEIMEKRTEEMKEAKGPWRRMLED